MCVWGGGLLLGLGSHRRLTRIKAGVKLVSNPGKSAGIVVVLDWGSDSKDPPPTMAANIGKRAEVGVSIKTPNCIHTFGSS